MNLDSKIAQWLSDAFSNHRNFIFAMTIDAMRRIYYIDVMDHETMKLVSRIGVDARTVESDDLDEFIKVVEPCLPFPVYHLTDEQIENIVDEVYSTEPLCDDAE